MKKCVVCGRDFFAGRSNQICCTKACLAKRNRERALARWYEVHGMEQKRNAYPVCQLCGKPITNARDHNQKFHDECVIADVKRTIMNGMNLSPAQRCRLQKRKIQLKDVRASI